MKSRWLIVIAIIIVLIVIALVTVIFFTKPSVSTQQPLSANPFADAVETNSANLVTAPDTFSVNFYKWYIGNRQADASFPSTQELSTSFTQWMTPSFILKYQSEIGNQDFDEDPILFAQDDPAGWGPGVTATIISQTDSASSVQVVIGSDSLAHTYTVGLIKNNGQWLINSISSNS